MHTSPKAAAVLVSRILLVACALAGPAARALPQVDRAYLAHAKRDPDQAILELGGDHLNPTFKIPLAADEKHKGVWVVFKPIDRRTPEQGGPEESKSDREGSQARSEWAVSELDEALQLGVVPVTVLRSFPISAFTKEEWAKELKGVRGIAETLGAQELDGSAQLYVEALPSRKLGKLPLEPAAAERLLILDFLTRNYDRKADNLLVLKETRTVDERDEVRYLPVAIDNGLGLQERPPAQFLFSARSPAVATPESAGLKESRKLIASIDEGRVAEVLHRCKLEVSVALGALLRLAVLKQSPELLLGELKGPKTRDSGATAFHGRVEKLFAKPDHGLGQKEIGAALQVIEKEWGTLLPCTPLGVPMGDDWYNACLGAWVDKKIDAPCPGLWSSLFAEPEERQRDLRKVILFAGTEKGSFAPCTDLCVPADEEWYTRCDQAARDEAVRNACRLIKDKQRDDFVRWDYKDIVPQSRIKKLLKRCKL